MSNRLHVIALDDHDNDHSTYFVGAWHNFYYEIIINNPFDYLQYCQTEHIITIGYTYVDFDTEEDKINFILKWS
jgi:hypothetical protein